jgi:tetratricopeptide (TPR) repeat protein
VLGRFLVELVTRPWRRNARPKEGGALRELVRALIQADKVTEALEVAGAAAAADPGGYQARLMLGFAHQKAHEPSRALEHYGAALAMQPSDPEVHDLLGSAYQELGRLEEALAEYDRALALRPDHAGAHFHRGLARLLLGDFARGWEDYEFRKLSAESSVPARRYPEWDGSPLGGRTLLVRREQGLGDEIMFASMVPEIMRSAKHCVLECEPRLHSLFSRSFAQASVFAARPDGSLPPGIASLPVDVESAAGSLARYLRPEARSFSTGSGYLKADAGRVAHWRARLAEAGKGLAVGISWTGGVRKTRRAVRSLPLANWLPLLQVPQVRFVSLQYTPEAMAEIAELRRTHGVTVEHWPEAIADYDETAALVGALDLVLSVCTSVVHLGGALGRPVWVLAPYSPEWRYGFKGPAMPWYSSVRVYRQPAYGAWDEVVGEVQRDLHRQAVRPAPA